MAIAGTLEVITGSKSSAQRVSVSGPSVVPSVLASDFGLRSIETASPVTVGTVTSAGAWTGTKGGKPSTARMWVDIPFEQTAIGKALAAGEIDPLNPEGSEG